ncbi:hypothetical protein [Crocinitomix algicola]|uniref:hypothetical protein n=1 Tax=Crocinitomix algicola TaxID=1740263 RepID=UPI0008725566|nr:hypothetical protein [Crocinitomix algicola]
MIERKCLACGTWNKGESHCTHCGNPISPEEVQKADWKKKELEEANKPKDKFDLFAERLKNSDSMFARIIYQIGYSIAMVFAAIGGFFAWMVAMANG